MTALAGDRGVAARLAVVAGALLLAPVFLVLGYNLVDSPVAVLGAAAALALAAAWRPGAARWFAAAFVAGVAVWQALLRWYVWE